MAFPLDLAFAGGMAYASYRAVGRWLKFADDTNKRADDAAYLSLFEAVLAEEAADGARQLAQPGAGAQASGQAQLWADWQRLNPRQRIALLMDMRQAVRWSGQEACFKPLARAPADAKWSQLSDKAKKCLLWATDAMDWNFVQQLVESGADLARTTQVWQVTEPVPQLSIEPAMAAAPAADAAALKEEINSREPLLLAAVEARQAELMAALSPAQELKVVEVGRQVALLREMAQGGLGLGSGGKAKRGQELLELLRGVSLVPVDGPVTASDKEAAAKALDAQVEGKLEEQRVAGEKAAEEAAAAARAQTVIGALQSRIRFQAGGKPLTPAAAAAVLKVAGEEVRVLGSKAGGKDAAQQLLALVSLMESAGAALAAHHGEDEEGGEAEGGMPQLCQEVCDTLEQLQEAAEGVIKAAAAGGEEPAAADAAGAAGAPASEKLVEVLGRLEEQVQQLGATATEPQKEEGEGEAVAAADGFDAEVAGLKSEVDGAAAAAKEAVQQKQEGALADAATKERLTIIMEKIKQITAAAAATPAAAEGEEGGEGSASLSSAERMVVIEGWLKQLGTRPLAAAVDGLQKLMGEAITTTTSSGSKTTAVLLGEGVTLEADSQTQLNKLTQLLSEIELCESVMRLELGPNLRSALSQLSSYLGQQGEPEQEEGEGQEKKELSPRERQEKEAAGKIREVVRELGGEGLVLLQLTGPQYRQLAQFREAVGMLKPGGDALMLDRCNRILKEVSNSLGPIGATIQTRLAAEEDAALRDALSDQKARAVTLYDALSAYLTFEDDVRAPLLKALRELRSAGSGLSASRDERGLQAALLKADAANEELATIKELLQGLLPAEEGGEGAGEAVAKAVAPALDAVATFEDLVEAAKGGLASYSAYVGLRSRALNPQAAADAAGGEEAGVLVNTLDDIKAEVRNPLTILRDIEPEDQGEWERVGSRAVARGQLGLILIATSTTPSNPAVPNSPPTLRMLQPDIGLPSNKCLLQLLAERVGKVQQLAATASYGKYSPVTKVVPWYIMVGNKEQQQQLEKHLREKGYYGLTKGQVEVFVAEGGAPAFNEELKLVMAGATRIAKAPIGSGELLPALSSSGVLSRLQRSGVRHVEVQAVDDNLLMRPADPMFLGYAISNQLGAAAKVVEPEVVAGALSTALGKQDAEGQSGEEQALQEDIGFLAPSIGAYYFSLPTLQQLVKEYTADHLAGYRLVPQAGIPSRPAAPVMPQLPPNATPMQRAQAMQAMQAAANAPPRLINGYAPVRLLADALASPVMESVAIGLLGVEGADEFSPLYSSGPHLVVPEPIQAVGDLMALHTSWVEALGATVEAEEGVEVSPLVSYAGEGLEKVAHEGVVFEKPFDPVLQGASAEATGQPSSNMGPLAVPMAVAYAAVCALALAKNVVGAKK